MIRPRTAFTLALVCSNAAGILVVLYLACTGRIHLCGERVPHFGGFPSVPTISFVELERTKPFTATVDQKRIGTWKAVVESSTGRPKPGAQPTNYVLVYLRKANGRQVALYQENPSPEVLAFALSLGEGRDYSFPGAITNRAAGKAGVSLNY
jgi:hypothetical protein